MGSRTLILIIIIIQHLYTKMKVKTVSQNPEIEW